MSGNVFCIPKGGRMKFTSEEVKEGLRLLQLSGVPQDVYDEALAAVVNGEEVEEGTLGARMLIDLIVRMVKK